MENTYFLRSIALSLVTVAGTSVLAGIGFGLGSAGSTGGWVLLGALLVLAAGALLLLGVVQALLHYRTGVQIQNIVIDKRHSAMSR
jgi:hypothetical protein